MELKEDHETDKDKTLQVVGTFGFIIRLRDLEDEQGRWQNARFIPTEVFEKDIQDCDSMLKRGFLLPPPPPFSIAIISISRGKSSLYCKG